MKRSVKLTISGSVQGVFYRNFVREKAEGLNINGFVRNLENGNVEAFLEGDNDKVEAMIEECKTGTKYATVKNVEIKEEKFQGLKGFNILHF